MKAGKAPRTRATGGAKKPNPRDDHLGLRHRKRKAATTKKTPKRCAKPTCWTAAHGKAVCTCKKKKAKTTAGQGPGNRPLVRRTNQLVPGITGSAGALYPGATVARGAAAQMGLRRPGGGAQPRAFINLPPRGRAAPRRYKP